MSAAFQIIAGTLSVFGAGFALVAAIGIIRLDDVFARMHAASKSGTLGSMLLLLAAAIQSADPGVALRAGLAGAFFLLTAPVSAHLLSRAAYFAGHEPTSRTLQDALAEAREEPDGVMKG